MIVDHLFNNKKNLQEGVTTENTQDTYNRVYQLMVRQKPEFMYYADNEDVKNAILKAMSFGSQISVNDLATYAYGLLKSNDINEQGVAESEQLNEFAGLIASGARLLLPLLARLGPKLGQAAARAGTAAAATSRVAGAAGRAGPAIKKGADVVGKVAKGAGEIATIINLANEVAGGVGEIYTDVKGAAAELKNKTKNALDDSTVMSLAQAAVKYSIPIGIIVALLYGGKNAINQVGSEQGVAETSDYSRRREREEDIISGKRPARQRTPAQTSDYARRRAQEKKSEQGVAEGANVDLEEIAQHVYANNTEVPWAVNTATGKNYTVDQLQGVTKRNRFSPSSTSTAPAAPAPTTSAGIPSAYGKTTYSMKPMTGIPGMKPPAAPAAPSVPKAPIIKYNFNLPAGGAAGIKTAPAPKGTKVVSGGPTPYEQAKLARRIAQAAKQPVAEMLAMVETKEDVARIKQFIDKTFIKYGAVTESAFAVRNQLIEHVTQVGAQRRKEHSQRMAK
jgi:hypothetical protein